MVYQKRCAVGLDRKCSPMVVPSIPGSRLEWPVGQAVKTAASHAANGGSIPPRVTIFYLTDGERYGMITKRASAKAFLDIVRVNGDEGTPVPIPNTVVKLVYGDNTWLATAREDNSTRTSNAGSNEPAFFILFS